LNRSRTRVKSSGLRSQPSKSADKSPLSDSYKLAETAKMGIRSSTRRDVVLCSKSGLDSSFLISIAAVLPSMIGILMSAMSHVQIRTH
jgi:hypothetical protein